MGIKKADSYQLTAKDSRIKRRIRCRKSYLTAFSLLLLSIFAFGCEQKAQTVATPITIPEGEKDPAVWGRVYPAYYDSYLKNKERTKGYSKYRNDDEDRLSPWPFQLVLLDGWGMGIEYNEPNGHTDMLKDQLKIDASRKKAGGVCLSCKKPVCA